MLTGRAWAIIAAGAILWLASRIIGNPDLHMVSVGLLALIPLATLLVRFMRHDLSAVRRLSTRRAFPGTRVRVDIEVRNLAERRTAMLLVEDRLPSALGPPGRGVLGEIRPGARRHISYDITPRSRGRYSVGPMTVMASDPFDLVRRRIEFDVQHDLIVYPEIEDIGRSRPSTPLGGAGESSTRQLLQAAEDFYTMRSYEEGDDLRRIHWPSVARTGELMIRQDESAKRAAASIFVDNRSSSFGGDRQAFEKAVSAAASVGALYLRTGFRLRLATAERAPAVVELDSFLEILALARRSRTAQMAPTLAKLAAAAAGGGALVVVTHVPDAADAATLQRLTMATGSKLAILVDSVELDDLPLSARHSAERRVEGARSALTRAGWDVLIIGSDERLGEVWPRRRARAPVAIAGSW
ncbi:MAG: DUF58 domain-containing protein [Actinomycetota bacterium]